MHGAHCTGAWRMSTGDQRSVEFAHLHLHSEFSLLDGLGKINDYMARMDELGMTAAALTDHGVMYGAMDWLKAGKKHNKKTIVGLEAYVAPDGMHKREKGSIHHLTLLARNEAGYRNLAALASEASLRGFYYRPRIDYDLLAKHTEGVTCLSGCLSSHLAGHILKDREAEARALIDNMTEWFGRDHLFLEVMDHGMPEQHKMTKFLVEESRRRGLPLVATNDVHFVRKEDHPAHDILLCIQTGATIHDPNRFASKTDQIYMKSGAEMLERFHEIPEAVANTLRVVEQCDLKLENPGFLMPHFAVPDGLTPGEYLEKLCRAGALKKYGHVEGEVRERLEYELGVINQMGFPTYFLVVWDFVRYAKEQGILVGPGRGSAAGSIVAYSLDITTVDPLRHGLLFERFLNPSRISMPDIDIDFADDRRDEIIKYVTEKYGADQVSQIITFGTLAARAAVRDVGRALGMSYGEVDQVAKLIPQIPAHPVSIGQALEQVPDLKALYDRDEGVRKLLDTARKLEGVSRHASTHAAGIVISRDPLVQHVPLQRTGTGDNAGITTQYPMGWLEELGLLKMDFLGLKTLTVLTKALKLIERKGVTVDLDALDLEDPAAYAQLKRGETMGIFQLDQPTGQRICALVKPSNFNELIAVGALARPGPMEYAPRFAARKEGREPVEYAHPDLEPILAETYGFPLVQEQVMQIARVLADYSMAEADNLRKAMGKKLPAEMAKHRDRFIEGCKKRGIDKRVAEPLFEELAKFSGYGFNKSHSACYALIGYWCAWLKAYHPAEFLAALLTSEQSDTPRLVQLIAECRRMKIDVLPPDVNRSERDFSVEYSGVLRVPSGQDESEVLSRDSPPTQDSGLRTRHSIRIGLSAVKNVGVGVVDAIIAARAAQPGQRFTGLAQFCGGVGAQMNKRALECLIKVGALRDLGNRQQLLMAMDSAMAAAQSTRKAAAAGQFGLFGAEVPGATDLLDVPLPDVPDFSLKEQLAFEKELLGIYLSEHPLQAVAARLRGRQVVTTLGSIDESMAGQRLTVVGLLLEPRPMLTKKGTMMLRAVLEGVDAISLDLIAFSEAYERCKEFCVADAVVEVDVRVDLRGEQVQLLVEEMRPCAEPEPVASAPTEERRLHLWLPARDDLELHGKVHDMLRAYPGNDAIYLHCDTPRGRRVLHPARLRVDAETSLVSALGALMGADAVRVEIVTRAHADDVAMYSAD
jgi:DNA polymerase-3 subunit alpha